MSFWSSQTYTRLGQIVFEPFEPNNIDSASYMLCLGTQVFVSPEPDTELKDRKVINLEPSQVFSIPAGQFAYLMTKEVVKIPHNCIGFISLRFKKKAKGLINVSGFHVDPGYEGKLIFAVYNSGGLPITLKEGSPLFLIWLSYLDESDTKPKGKGFTDIPEEFVDAKDPSNSLTVLAKKMKDFEKTVEKYSTVQTITLSLLVPFNIALLNFMLNNDLASKISNHWRMVLFLLLLILAFFLYKNFVHNKYWTIQVKCKERSKE